jgi:hypothetical protein
MLAGPLSSRPPCRKGLDRCSRALWEEEEKSLEKERELELFSSRARVKERGKLYCFESPLLRRQATAFIVVVGGDERATTQSDAPTTVALLMIFFGRVFFIFISGLGKLQRKRKEKKNKRN